jgi:uncharacterized protein
VPLTPAEMDKNLDEHFDFEARDDVLGVLATPAPDVEHDIVGYPLGPRRGRDGARDDESLWRGRAPGTPFGLEARNRPLEFRLLHVVRFADNGDIKRENVWLDLAAIIQQLPKD